MSHVASHSSDHHDVIVIGAGLAGLAAAAYAAREGASVLVLERTESVGGRARTHESSGFSFNVGPHALYADREADSVLRELGVSFSGRRPPTSSGLAYDGGRLHTLPAGLVSLLTTSLLPLSGKMELARFLGGIAKVDAASLQGRSVRQWTRTTLRNDGVRALVEALIRLTSYSNHPEHADAGAHLEQMQAGLKSGVYYVDGGWRTLSSGLARAATECGASIQCSARVRSVQELTAGGWQVRTDDGTHTASAIVLAVPPPAAAGMLEPSRQARLRETLASLRPVKAACLDLGLETLPNPRALFALGVDRPLYFSVHSASAKLAPEGAAVIHVARYLSGDEDPKAVEAELETLCDLMQPGWRQAVVERRFLPSMTVVGALVEAGKPRPSVEVCDASGLYLAGDWVGDEGMLADSALASGRRAGRLAGSRTAAAPVVRAA
ncbi:MAG TPA: FAD-dependent oxidoreductase [Candidatus Limnocylindrales bacterium]|nr:FAD-dependent oxidoreductase [Candidatus Limnocylindrales bacterium]